MVVRDPGQEEKNRQTPRPKEGEDRGVERERNGAKRHHVARASADRRECGLPAEGSPQTVMIVEVDHYI
ncbi:hypothetical protein KH990_10040 [Methanoculleus bourgensis]|uniref:Uncharacterized protein n=1 Tax=Methanoculleus bourgensis TaxID=83986 RepID=A0A0X3BJZ8_9EURY|nr:hypothetical protein [Methanoculleus bourgensis]MBT0733700.1 hypothetical protein [Methanoculleus bourgensis]CVK32472.1 protein of unknown function [Methanoculleus bourgensis]